MTRPFLTSNSPVLIGYSRLLLLRPICRALPIAMVVILTVVPVSAAYRPANKAETRVIRRVVAKAWHREATIPCPTGGGDSFHFYWASISTVDPHFALTEIKDSGCTYTRGYFLRRRSRHSRRWQIIRRRLDNAQSCSYFRRSVPEAVLREFAIEGLVGQHNTGPLGLC